MRASSARSPISWRSRTTTRSRFARIATAPTSSPTIRISWRGSTTTGLREIPGIGKDLAARIREIAETGGAEYHRELVAEFPPTMLDLLHLQGVGPKTVATLYRELGVRTLDDLEQAATDGRIRSLRGMGAKKEALILKALEERERYAGRHLLSDAHEAADALRRVSCASARPARRSSRSAACGAAATPAATSTCSPPAPPPSLMDDFVDYPLVERVLGHGDTKSSVLLRGGFQADLRLVAPDSRGAAMQYFTGSKAHNIALRDRAIGLGFKLNEYGLFRIADDSARRRRARRRRLRRARPRLDSAGAARGARRNRGRRRARAAPARSIAPICAAICTCTAPKPTAGTTSRTMAAAAREAGLEYIAITDHSQSLAMANGLDERRALAHAARIRALDARGRRHPAAGRHRMRHQAGRHARSGRRLPRRARHRRRVGALGLQSGSPADDRPAAARDRESARRHPRPSDRPACS